MAEENPRIRKGQKFSGDHTSEETVEMTAHQRVVSESGNLTTLKIKQEKFSVRRKIAFSFAFMVLLFIFTVVVAVNRLSTINDRLDRIVEVTAVKQLLAAEIDRDSFIIQRAMRSMFFIDAQVDKYALEMVENEKMMNARLEKFSSLALPEEKQALEEVKKDYQEWRKISREVEQLVRAGTKDAAEKLAFTDGQQAFDKLDKGTDVIVTLTEQTMALDRKNSDENYIMMRNFFWILGFLLTIAGIGIYLFLNRDMMNVVDNIQSACMKIVSSANEILAASKQQQSTTTEQSNQMNEIQSTLNEAASTSAEISSTAQEISSFTKQTGEEAKAGSRLIKETTDKMLALKESNKNISDRLNILSEKIQGIGKMLTTILAVADQTNLLSLNAAIEAAKAGEQGKGFSVVAQEIRRLADQTAQSSKEISNLINEIQAASTSAIMTMEKSTQDTNSGTALVTDFSSRFASITEKVQTILPQIENISKTITEQATGNKEIVATINQMTEALQLTAASAKQLNQTVLDLTVIGQQLRGAVARV